MPTCRALRAVATVALVALASSASALTFTCEGVARKGGMDPAGAVFTGKFGDQRRGGPAINAAGDVTFFAAPRGAGRRLYLYPAVGAPSILAEESAAARGGGTFKRFQWPSINDAGDVGFFAELGFGEGVFIKPAAGSLFQVARTGNPAPGGGMFAGFGGYRGSMPRATSCSRRRQRRTAWGVPLRWRDDDAHVGGADRRRGARRPRDLPIPRALGGPRRQPRRVSRLQQRGVPEPHSEKADRHLSRDRVRHRSRRPARRRHADARHDLRSVPRRSRRNASDQVLVRAQADGSPLFTGLFLFDPVSAATTIVGTGDPVPGGGFLKTIAEPSLLDDGRAASRPAPPTRHATGSSCSAASTKPSSAAPTWSRPTSSPSGRAIENSSRRSASIAPAPARPIRRTSTSRAAPDSDSFAAPDRDPSGSAASGRERAKLGGARRLSDGQLIDAAVVVRDEAARDGIE